MFRYALAVLALLAAPAQAAALKGECPAGYEVKEGLNTDFPHAGMSRAFFVHPAKGIAGPAPVWVPLTGTMESTFQNLNVARSDRMPR